MVKSLIGHTKEIIQLISLNDGKIVSSAADETIRIWDPKDHYNCIRTISLNYNYAVSMLLLNDGKILLGCEEKQFLYFTKVKNKNELRYLYLDGLVISFSKTEIQFWSNY